MRKHNIRFFKFLWLLILLAGCGKQNTEDNTIKATDTTVIKYETTEQITTSVDTIEIDLPCTHEIIEKPDIEELECVYNTEYILIAKVTYAEAGNQDEMGKRLVIDTILNRVDSSRFPDTITDVVTQPNQYVGEDTETFKEDIYNLVVEEVNDRTNYEVLFFRTGHYHDFGIPVIHHQDHYFSK